MWIYFEVKNRNSKFGTKTFGNYIYYNIKTENTQFRASYRGVEVYIILFLVI